MLPEAVLCCGQPASPPEPSALSATVVLRLRLPDARLLAVVVLERQVRRAVAEVALRDLRQRRCARLDAEPAGVEWILDAQADRCLVAVELLADGEVRELQRGHPAAFHLHR